MNWTKKVIDELIRTKTSESNTLEFKRADALYNSMKKSGSKHDDLSKDVSSMANSNGGAIIYGIQEFNSGKDKCKAEKIDCVNGEIISEEWIEQVINTRITPRIENVKIIKVEYEGSDCVYILDIPKSNTAHQAQDKKYYKRFNFQSVPMDDWEIKDIISRKNNPEIHISLSAYPTLLSNVKMSDSYQIDIIVHNLGMIGANYLNCFVEIDKEARRYIKSPHPTVFSNHVQVSFNNKEDQEFKIGEDTIKMPSVYDPLLPMVYKTIGVINVRKKFLKSSYKIVCKVATESTFTEKEFISSKIKIIND